jgi:hypothetical protein
MGSIQPRFDVLERLITSQGGDYSLGFVLGVSGVPFWASSLLTLGQSPTFEGFQVLA